MSARKPLFFGIGIIRTYLVTIRHFFMKSVTIQYPHARIPISDRSRGMLRIKGVIDADTGFTPDFREMAPCVAKCPANVNAQGYVGLIAQGRYDDAYELHMENNPLPGMISRVCPHPCERACRRGEEDAPVTICDLKGYMFDNVSAGRRLKVFTLPKARKNKKVAVVGAGPAGLSVAFWLGKCGYDVVIFEKLPTGGGALRAAINPTRLPVEIIDQEVEDIRKMCVAIRTNTPVGPGGLSLDELFAKEFDAIFLAIGAHRKIPVKGVADKVAAAAPEPTRAEKNAWLTEQGVHLDDQGNIVVDSGTNLTSQPAVFAGGEAILGPGVAITAIGSARRAAQNIDIFLNNGLSDYWTNGFPKVETIKSRYDAEATRPAKVKPGEAKVPAKGFTEKEAIIQAERCLSCMTEQCIGCRICEMNCPALAMNVTVSQNKTRKINGFEVDYGKCQLCGICSDVCPTRTLTHTPEFATADYGLPEMTYGKEKMLRVAPLREDKHAKPVKGQPEQKDAP